MIKPISLRLRPDEVTTRARALLRRLDKEISEQRQVKFFAAKALSAVYQMDTAAEPGLRSLSASDRDCWQADRKAIVAILLKISRRGVL